MKRIAMITFAAALAVACGKKDKPADNTGSAGSAGSAVVVAGSGSDTGSAGAAMGSAGSDAGSAGSAGSGSAAVAVDTGSGAAPAADTTTQIDVPTQGDFEAEAQKKITEKNLEAEISAMEKQLAN